MSKPTYEELEVTMANLTAALSTATESLANAHHALRVETGRSNELTAQVHGLAAENDLILGLAPRYELLPEKHPDWDRAYRIGWNAHQGALEAMRDKMEAPITDAALAEIRAQGVEMFIELISGTSGMLYADSVKSTAADFAQQLRKEQGK